MQVNTFPLSKRVESIGDLSSGLVLAEVLGKYISMKLPCCPAYLKVQMLMRRLNS
jgi:hypothetical protein